MNEVIIEKRFCDVINTFHAVYIKYTISILNILLAFIATTGNSIICIAILKSKTLRCVTPSYFIVSLSIADLLIGAVVEPLYSVMLIDWSQKTCHLEKYKLLIGFFTCSVSIGSAIFVCIDRMIKICKPFKYDMYVTKLRALLAVICVWLFGGGIGYISVFLENKKIVAFGTVAWVVAATIMGIFCSVEIYQVGKKQIHDIVSNSLNRANIQGKKSIIRERKLALSLCIVLGAILICWFPFTVTNCLIQFFYTEETWRRFFITRICTITLGYANSSMNIFIFSFKNREIRKAIRNLLGLKKRSQETRHVGLSAKNSSSTNISNKPENVKSNNCKRYGSIHENIVENPYGTDINVDKQNTALASSDLNFKTKT